jgi:beta-N-acetylhexosaminidase
LSLEQLCGQLLVVGIDGRALPATVANAIHAGRRGGTILFKRNLPDLETTHQLCSSIRSAFPPDIPAFIGIDEEGGRVSRLPEPFERLPPMRQFGALDDPALTYRVATWLGRCLATLGFTCDFAPVLDVDSNPNNPIIGDRSFSHEPALVIRHAKAFIAGLQEQGIAACGKHFPGHGDTTRDSHVDLPAVEHPRSRLESIELAPFRACASSGLFGMMTAHVVYPGLDRSRTPATLSRPIITDVLRRELGFPGVIFSDDLQMGAVTQHTSVESAACLAIRAGCDALLVCRGDDTAERILAALVAEAQRDESMRVRIEVAASAFIAARRRFLPVLPATLSEFRDQWAAIGQCPCPLA